MKRSHAFLVLDLAGGFSVTKGGLKLGDPPARSVAILLVGLASRGDAWSGRAELAQTIYPDTDSSQARAALRQAVHRLKSWIGEECLEQEADRIRLTPGEFELTFDKPGSPRVPVALIAPGLNHPWLDALRLKWGDAKDIATRPAESAFIRAVEEAARLDVNAARPLFLAGSAFIETLTVAQLSHLLNITKPRTTSDVQAEDHLVLQAELYHRVAAIDQALLCLRRAYSLAKRKRNQGVCRRAQAYYLFGLLESGHMDSANELLKSVPFRGRSHEARLLEMNATAAYYWNSNRLGDAVATMSAEIDIADRYDRQQQLHFWTNLSVLAAEARRPELSKQAEARARQVLVPKMDLHASQNLLLAQGTRLMTTKRADEACVVLRELEAESREYGWTIGELYALDTLAEAYALSGDPQRARKAWNAAAAGRKAANLTLTPRLLARKRRIFALI